MTLASPSSEIKNAHTTPVVLGMSLLLSCLLSLTAGCISVAPAPFRERPDSTEPGEVLGPFSGRLIDAATRKPIGGAHVAVEWQYQTEKGLVAGAHELTKTNADGRYFLPRLPAPPSWPKRVAGATVVAYQPGYVAYRSDRYFPDLRDRHDFAQEGGTIALERLTGDVSRLEHLRFLDRLAALFGSLLDRERKEAGQELVGNVQRHRDGPLLDASVLLSLDELRTITGYNGPIALERLADVEQSATYDSRHFRADGRPESFDVAYRVWHPATAEDADARYEQVLKTTPNKEERDELGDRSLRGHEGTILAAGALDRDSRVVILLTCGQSQCRDISQVVAILRRLMGRVDRLSPSGTSPE